MKTFRILASAGLVASTVVLASGVLSTVSGAAPVKNCVPNHLKVSMGTAQGTAGTIYHPIIVTNVGVTVCALWGVPSVQPVVGGATHSRVHVGPLARNVSMGEMPVRQTLKPAHSVSDAFGVTESGNYTKSTCLPKNAGAIIVTLGNFVGQAYVQRLAVHFGVHGNGGNSHVAAGADDAHGDLAAVGDQDFVEHRGSIISRKAVPAVHAATC